MLRNGRLPTVVAVALIAGLFALANCTKSDDKKSKKKPTPAKTETDAGKKVAKAPVDAAATAVKKDDAGSDKPKPPGGDTGNGDGKGDGKGDGGGDGKGDGKGKKLTNLKILPKNMTYKQVKTYMKKVMVRGLGQKCSFCHDKNDYAADTNKHKKMARGMMRMTADLNKKHFGGKQKITCYTCHLGKKEP